MSRPGQRIEVLDVALPAVPPHRMPSGQEMTGLPDATEDRPGDDCAGQRQASPGASRPVTSAIASGEGLK